MTDVLAVGETMLVLRTLRPGRLAVRDRLEVGAAGAESNVAIGLARLGHDVQLVGVVGDDDAGAAVLSAIRAEGVRWAGRVDPDAPTGLLLRTDRAPWLSRVGYYRRGSAGAAPVAGRPRRSAGRPTTRRAHERRHGCAGRRARAAVVAALAQARAGLLRRELPQPVDHRAEAAEVLAEVLPSLHVLFCGEDELPVLAAALGRDDADDRRRLDARPRARAGDQVRGARRGLPGRGRHASTRRRTRSRWSTRSARVTRSPPATSRRCWTARRRPIGWRAAALVAAYCVAGVGDTDTLPTRADLDAAAGERVTVR